jgi:hypothetical protein
LIVPLSWLADSPAGIHFSASIFSLDNFSNPVALAGRPSGQLERTLAPAWPARAGCRGLSLICSKDLAMTLRLTPDMLAAGYDFLRTTVPFVKWSLPEADEVGFHVMRNAALSADFGVEQGIPFIRVSDTSNGHAVTLLASLAHEMIHLRQHLTGDRELHGSRFKRMAARVCAAHGFDPKVF